MNPANMTLLEPLLNENAPLLSKTYVEAMPYWLQAKFFDPESERNRLLIHDYQKQEIQDMKTKMHPSRVGRDELVGGQSLTGSI